jgi:3-(3-hydroxy-phenyl)propionate hydroxylase
MNHHDPAAREPVIAVGAGPAGCTAALLLADFGIPVTVLERHAQPHPLPRAVHLDDEVARTLDRIGVSEGFLARSRPGSGLRLLDAGHRVMAEFSRDHQASQHGFPQANMFHQPDLEELLFARVEAHPLIDFRRGAEVTGLDGTAGPLTGDPVRMHARTGGETQTFTGPVVLGCDGASSTIRKLAGITMDDLGFTERWLVIDIKAGTGLDTWDGVEQICDPARAATFMQVTGDRYRWEFRLRDGEDEAGRSPRRPSAGYCGPGPAAATWTACRSSAAPPTPSAPRWPPASGPGRSSCSATPPTSPRRSSGRAWRAGCATLTTWPGSSPTCSPAGPGTTCSTPMTPNAARTPQPW